MKTAAKKRRPEPAWDIALRFPLQGQWEEADYFALDDNFGAELSNGRLEVLPMPSESHQFILARLFTLLTAFVEAHGLGAVLFSGLPVRLKPGKLRQPDVVFMRKENDTRRSEECWNGADLVMEAVSPGKKNRERDLMTKRREYARAGIPEYWIVDAKLGKIVVLKLEGTRYVVHGEFKPGETATSPTLPGFAVDVSAAFANAKRAAKKTRPPKRS